MFTSLTFFDGLFQSCFLNLIKNTVKIFHFQCHLHSARIGLLSLQDPVIPNYASKTGTDILKPWANLFHAKFFEPKPKGTNSTDCSSAIWMQWYAWEQSSQQKYFFPIMCCAESAIVVPG